MAEKVKIKTEYGTISATPEQAKNWEARKEQDKIQKERIAAVKENARTMNRYRQQKQTYKDQTKARELKNQGGYDSAPTNRYGKPIESFWAKEPPAMPEMRTAPAMPTVPAMPKVPQMSAPTISGQLNARNMDFYQKAQRVMRPYYETRVQDYRPTQYGPYSETGGYTWAGSDYPTGNVDFVLPWNTQAYERWKNVDTPISGSNLLSGTENVGWALKPPMFPYWPRVY
jgi:hypothetical protein